MSEMLQGSVAVLDRRLRSGFFPGRVGVVILKQGCVALEH